MVAVLSMSNTSTISTKFSINNTKIYQILQSKLYTIQRQVFRIASRTIYKSFVVFVGLLQSF